MEGNRAAKGIKIKGGAFRAFLLLVLIINCAYLQNGKPPFNFGIFR